MSWSGRQGLEDGSLEVPLGHDGRYGEVAFGQKIGDDVDHERHGQFG